MRIVVAAIGRLKAGPDQELCIRYWQRFEVVGRSLGLGPVTLIEMPESRAAMRDARIADEAGRLLKAAPAEAVIIALDERGRGLSSADFADLIRTRRDAGAKAAAFLIGGADGHGRAVLDAATVTLSLSAMTLPHGLARIVLVEQLYRAATILSGHPYHRV